MKVSTHNVNYLLDLANNIDFEVQQVFDCTDAKTMTEFAYALFWQQQPFYGSNASV